MTKPMYTLPCAPVKAPKWWCQVWKHDWRFNNGEQLCARCGAYRWELEL